MFVEGDRSSGEEMVEAPTVIVDTGDFHKDLFILTVWRGIFGGRDFFSLGM